METMGRRRNRNRPLDTTGERRRSRRGRDSAADAGSPLSPFPPLPFSPARFSPLLLAVCALLALAVGLTFGQTGRYQFVNIDDDECVYQNREVTDGLSKHGLKSALTQSQSEAWVPLTSISHMLDWQVYGDNAGGHHLTNVLLHAAAAVLLFLALTQLAGGSTGFQPLGKAGPAPPQPRCPSPVSRRRCPAPS